MNISTNQTFRKINRRDNSIFDPVEDLLVEIRAGRPVIMFDDEARENEGDLILAAEHATAANINFFLLHARGLLCVPITHERAQALQLSEMVVENRDSYRTDFTVSVDASDGISTGISAGDRARTIRLLASPCTRPEKIVRPGHVFPLRAKPGGVLQRAGHTEAAVDLARLAGLDPSAVICEILNDDGSVARLPDLIKLKLRHGLKIGVVRDLIAYRLRHEKMVELIETVKMPTRHGNFDLYLYRTAFQNGKQQHIALVKGDISGDEPVLVRVHSECLTGDVFGSLRCDCGSQLEVSLERLEREGRGILIYLRQEGRGIGLEAKIQAYKLQEQGLDTFEANTVLGYSEDLREYSSAAQILASLGVCRIRLMTDNPCKSNDLTAHGIQLEEILPLQIMANIYNQNYLKAKEMKFKQLY